MALRSLPGTSFAPQVTGGVSIIQDVNSPSAPISRTTGATRVATLATQPTVSNKWKVLGWSIQLLVGILRSILAGTGSIVTACTFGKLMAGLLINTTLDDANYPILPPDMSTFTEVWNPNDNGQIVLNDTVPDDANEYLPIGLTYMFPSPITVEAGGQLQFALILQRSLIHCGGSLVNGGAITAGLEVRYADFTLLYDD